MNSERMKKIVADMISHLLDEEKDKIRNMSDEELITLNHAWGRSICYSYRLGRDKSGNYPNDASIEILKAVRKTLQNLPQLISSAPIRRSTPINLWAAWCTTS